ncbi:MAG: hypothetical protein JJT89_15175 [Nitriliruptoraceae bacterium]|nr:hypothetical protein [Nitriliruptoraceae bacterium]
MSTTCPACAAEPPAAARFCRDCGAPLPPTAPPVAQEPPTRRTGPAVALVGVVGVALAIVTTSVLLGSVLLDDDPAGRLDDAAVDVDGPDVRGDEVDGDPACPGGVCVVATRPLDRTGARDAGFEAGLAVVLRDDGLLEALALRDGATRWSRTVTGARSVQTSVADVLPVVTDDGIVLLGLGDGEELGRITLADPEVTSIGPWVIAADDEQVGAWSVTGRPGWTRRLDTAERVVLSPEGVTSLRATTDADGEVVRTRIASLFTNTGAPRFELDLARRIDTVHRREPVVVAVSHDPAEVVVLDRLGGVVETTTLPDLVITSSALSPEGRSLVLVTEGPTSGRHQLWILPTDGSTAPGPRPLSPGRLPLEPVILDDAVVLAVTEPRPQLLSAELATAAQRYSVELDEVPHTLVATGERTVASLSDDGTLTLLDLEDGASASLRLGGDAVVLRARPLTVAHGRVVQTIDPRPAATGG